MPLIIDLTVNDATDIPLDVPTCGELHCRDAQRRVREN